MLLKRKFGFLPVFLFFIGVKNARGSESDGLALLQYLNITKLTTEEVEKAGYNISLVQDLTLSNLPYLSSIAVEDLKKMTMLRSIYITEAPKLQSIPPLPSLPKLQSFRVINSGLLEVPDLSRVHEHNNKMWLHYVDFEANHIKHIPAHALRLRADQVSLNGNQIEEIPAHAFKNAEISELSFRGNTKLKRLDPHAFTGNLIIRKLDLSATSITELPASGLEKLEILKIEKTPSLKYIPSIYRFQHLEEAYLTHHFHCCAFKFPERHDPAGHALHKKRRADMEKACKDNPEGSKIRRRRNLDLNNMVRRHHLTAGAGWGSLTETDPTPTASSEYNYEISDEDNYISDSGSQEGEDDWSDNGFHEQSLPIQPVNAICGNINIRIRNITCQPQPNALNPCEDVMGWGWLRACVWFVVAAAVAGNSAVLIVLLANRADLTVPRFLMCHLALADLCTGLYLFMLATVDLKSFGEYFNYAFNWQYGAGCKVAGFFSVFSGQLSVFTLAVVTLERWFAITYAIYLERRISLPAAAKIMAGGWIFAATMAGLPLFGVSDYSSTSICLPVESNGIADGLYQGSLFLTNAVAWVTIVACYVQIYRSLGGGGERYGGRAAAAAAERRIANKMALLIGTDLLCWAPVAFFGVTALAGVPLVDVSHGKVLLVFFYPLNACANPFLYAILTKQYRRDLMALIARQGWCSWAVARYKMAATPPPTAHTNPSAPAPLLPINPNQSTTNYNFKDTTAEEPL